MDSSVDEQRITDKSGVEAVSQNTLNEFTKKETEDVTQIEKNLEADKEEEDNWSDARSTLPPIDKADEKGDTKQETSLSTDLNFEETDDGLKIKWTPVERFTKYLPVIERLDVEESTSKETEKYELLFKTNVYNWKTGEEIAVQLFATDQTDKKHALTEKLQYVIGGSTTISRLRVEKNSKNPFTGVDLEWCAPKHTPESYQVAVFKSEQNQLKEKKTLNDTKITIDNLTPSTSYYFKVVAVYTDGSVGKRVRSLDVKTRDDPNAQQVEILKDMQMRHLKVKWNNYALSNTSYYIVYLKSDEKSERIGERRVEKTKDEVYFYKLKSDTDYVAHVITMGTNNEVMAESVSNPVSTNKVQRSSSFDIKIAGKPVINACGADVKNDKMESFLSWGLPDLGNESINFDFIGVQAFIAENRQNAKKTPLEVQENTRARPKGLEFGKTYQFDITCTYRDLDSLNLREATATKSFQTGICPPSEPDVHFTNKEIKVSWEPAKGAKEYALTIMNEDMEPVKKTVLKGTSTKFPMARSYMFGNKRTFVLTAFGENGTQESSKKDIVIGGDNAVTDVVAEASRKRSIIVTWQPPKKSTKKYRIRLYEELPKKKILEKTVSAQDECTVTFENLKAGASYFCKVFSERNGKFKNGSLSDTVKTIKAERNRSFNVELAGKPTITECKAILREGKYKSAFRWTLPNIGAESYNFTHQTKAFFTKDKKEQQLELKDAFEAKPVILGFGESYVFSVKCTYKDLDDDTTYQLEDTRTLDTDIGTPIISDITWKDWSIIIEWQSAEGATEHDLSVYDGDTKTCLYKQQIDARKHVLKMEGACRYGRTCNFVIRATRDKRKEKTVELKVLVGGDTICTEVMATTDGICPRRAVLLTWVSPKKPPIGYRAEILEISGMVTCSEALEATSRSYKFEKLKSDTEYICQVRPLYKDEESGNFSASNPLRTEKRCENAVEKQDNFGKPGFIREEIARKDENGFTFEISWDEVKVGENFKLEKYHIDVYEPGMFRNDYYLRRDCKTTKIKTPLLKPGKTIKVDITTTYKDLDTLKEQTTIKDYSFSTRPNRPQQKYCHCEAEVVTLKWYPVDGAQKYHVVVQDLKSNTIKTETVINQSCEVKFDISDKICIGKNYRFILTADLNKVKSEPSSKTYLLGGDHAVTNVVAKKHEILRRAIVVEWEPPEKHPKSYEVEICEKNKNKRTTISQTELMHTFAKLKTSTTYICKVSPKYDDGLKNGSYSNLIKTDKKIIPSIENDESFGKPEKIYCDDSGSNEDDHTSIDLSWSSIDAGENYEISGFLVTVSEQAVPTKIISTRNLKADERKVKIENVKKGYIYDVIFTTELMDLDSGKQRDIRNTQKICIRPSTTYVEKCEAKDDRVVFTWKAVDGATRYCLIIKDEFLTKEILVKNIDGVDQSAKICEVEVDMSKEEEVRIGKTYMTKITSYANDLQAESEWKAHLIGGNLVPRNVTASECTESPQRCIKVAFDAPKEGAPDEYKVEPRQTSVINNIKHGKNSPLVVEYLRQGMEYSFNVSARHGEKWSGTSVSNLVKTQKREGTSEVNNIENVKGNVNLNVIHSSLTASSPHPVLRSPQFDLVRAIRTKKSHEDERDILQLEWKIPSFDKYASDYKIEQFEVEVNNEKYEVPFVKGEQNFRKDGIALELGKMYTIAITTIYIDIDANEQRQSNEATSTVVTRPCRPIVTQNKIIDGNKLRIEWNDADGASDYVVHVFTDNSKHDQPQFRKEMKQTIFERDFDETFGFGTTYYAVIEAITDKKSYTREISSTTTAKTTIGGDYVPTQVKSTIQHHNLTDPSTQVYLTWNPPIKVPVTYEVYFSNDNNCNFQLYGKTECLVSGLKAGTYYTFKVVAIHNDETGDEKKSGGCFSEKIETSRKPNQVQNVRHEPGEDTCTSIFLKWNQVKEVKEDDLIEYRVKVTTLDEKVTYEVSLTNYFTMVSGLEPDTEYFAAVAAGNSSGYGEYSSKLKFKTDLGKPQNVELRNCEEEEFRTSELLLIFSAAKGKPQKYIARLYNEFVPVSDLEEVKSGHMYKGLKANSTYHVEIHAEFENHKKGEVVCSKKALTAPPKPEFIEEGCGCCKENGEFSSRDLTLKWLPITGCSIYEVRIIVEENGSTENEILVKDKIEVAYSCQREACKYSIQVRAKNTVFGSWSKKKYIELGPSDLKNIEAKLDTKNGNVIIQCEKKPQGPLWYCMQALCNDEIEGRVEKKTHASIVGDYVQFMYSPQKAAELYTFELWAEKTDERNGKRTRSNTIISRPEKVKNLFLVPAKDSPSTKIEIKWDAVRPCTVYDLLVRDIAPKTSECLIRVKKVEKDSCEYILCRQAGGEYAVCVRGVHECIAGDWSHEATVYLAPSDVEHVEIEITEHPYTVKATWKPLDTKPNHYVVALYQNGKVTHEEKTSATEHNFTCQLILGSFCYCTVFGQNDGGRGKIRHSKQQRLGWPDLELFESTLDVDDPSRKAKIYWKKPIGIDHVKLEIYDNCSGLLSKLEQSFESDMYDLLGKPGNTYDVRLFLGSDSNYADKANHLRVTMAPGDIEGLASKVDDGFIVYTWNPLENPPNKFNIKWKADNDSMIRESTKEPQFKKRPVSGAKSYKIEITALNESGEGRTTTLEHVAPVPEVIQNLESKEVCGAIIYEWKQLEVAPEKYIVQWRVNNEPITKESTKEPKFEIRFLKPAQSYSLRVMAKNNAGNGEMSAWNTFITDPLPPRNLTVTSDEKAPQTSFIVKYEDDIDPLKKYKVTAVVKEGDKNVEKKIVTTKKLCAHITGLGRGKSYLIKVQTIFCGKKSEELFYQEH